MIESIFLSTYMFNNVEPEIARKRERDKIIKLIQSNIFGHAVMRYAKMAV